MTKSRDGMAARRVAALAFTVALGGCTPAAERPTWVCLVAAGSAEREPIETRCDGVENDCDGKTDEELASGALTPQISVLVPPYLWPEAKDGALMAVELIEHALVQAGLPFEPGLRPPGEKLVGPAPLLPAEEMRDIAFVAGITDAVAKGRSVIVIPGYVMGYLLAKADDGPSHLDTLRAFVEGAASWCSTCRSAWYKVHHRPSLEMSRRSSPRSSWRSLAFRTPTARTSTPTGCVSCGACRRPRCSTPRRRQRFCSRPSQTSRWPHPSRSRRSPISLRRTAARSGSPRRCAATKTWGSSACAARSARGRSTAWAGIRSRTP